VLALGITATILYSKMGVKTKFTNTSTEETIARVDSVVWNVDVTASSRVYEFVIYYTYELDNLLFTGQHSINTEDYTLMPAPPEEGEKIKIEYNVNDHTDSRVLN